MALATSASLGVRHATVRRAVEALSLDALVVTNPTNIRYLTNHAGSAGTLVATAGAMHLLVDFRYQEAIRQLQQTESACPSMQVWSVAASYDEALLDCLGRIVDKSLVQSAGGPAGRPCRAPAGSAGQARSRRGTARPQILRESDGFRKDTERGGRWLNRPSA